MTYEDEFGVILEAEKASPSSVPALIEKLKAATGRAMLAAFRAGKLSTADDALQGALFDAAQGIDDAEVLAACIGQAFIDARRERGEDHQDRSSGVYAMFRDSQARAMILRQATVIEGLEAADSEVSNHILWSLRGISSGCDLPGVARAMVRGARLAAHPARGRA